MRMFTSAALATALLGAASLAYAADATGTIKSLDTTKDMVTLDNGSSYMAPKGVKLSDFKVGEKVTVSYTKAGDKMDITTIKPAT
jgi:Cu/Ag efflux protein CusF